MEVGVELYVITLLRLLERHKTILEKRPLTFLSGVFCLPEFFRLLLNDGLGL